MIKNEYIFFVKISCKTVDYFFFEYDIVFNSLLIIG